MPARAHRWQVDRRSRRRHARTRRGIRGSPSHPLHGDRNRRLPRARPPRPRRSIRSRKRPTHTLQCVVDRRKRLAAVFDGLESAFDFGTPGVIDGGIGVKAGDQVIGKQCPLLARQLQGFVFEMRQSGRQDDLREAHHRTPLAGRRPAPGEVFSPSLRSPISHLATHERRRRAALAGRRAVCAEMRSRSLSPPCGTAPPRPPGARTGRAARSPRPRPARRARRSAPSSGRSARPRR